MHPCSEYIESIYLDKRVNEFIAKIKPIELQDDLKQEMALVLLSYDCNKIIEMHKSGNLLAFTISTIKRMGTLPKSNFYKTFRKNDIDKAIEYFKTLVTSPIDYESANIGRMILKTKLQLDANQAHESIIFDKYIELRSCKKVADYFCIPHLHVFKVVKKVKQELKDKINKTI